MTVRLVTKSQVRMLAEGVTYAAPPAASAPIDRRSRCMFAPNQIRSALPEPGGPGWRALQVSKHALHAQVDADFPTYP